MLGCVCFQISSEFEEMWRGCGKRQGNMRAYSFLLLQSPVILDQLINSSEPQFVLIYKMRRMKDPFLGQLRS